MVDDFEVHPIGTGERLKALEAEVAELKSTMWVTDGQVWKVPVPPLPAPCACIDDVLRAEAQAHGRSFRSVPLGGQRR